MLAEVHAERGISATGSIEGMKVVTERQQPKVKNLDQIGIIAGPASAVEFEHLVYKFLRNSYSYSSNVLAWAILANKFNSHSFKPPPVIVYLDRKPCKECYPTYCSILPCVWFYSSHCRWDFQLLRLSVSASSTGRILTPVASSLSTFTNAPPCAPGTIFGAVLRMPSSIMR